MTVASLPHANFGPLPLILMMLALGTLAAAVVVMVSPRTQP
jgi:hypothetical protein